MHETENLIKTLPKKLKFFLFALWIDLVEFYKYQASWNYPTITNAIIN
jgi:hypothetical protein